MKKEIKENWEKEFDNLWDYNGCSECVGIEVDMDKVKSFIRQLLEAREKEILDEIEKELPEKYNINLTGFDQPTISFWGGFNQCLNQIKQNLHKNDNYKLPKDFKQTGIVVEQKTGTGTNYNYHQIIK